VHSLRITKSAAFSIKRIVDLLSITPPGGATDPPLRHPRLPHACGVACSAGTDFASDDLTRVQPDTSLHHDAVAALGVGRKAMRLDLNTMRREVCAECIILQRGWCAVSRHEAGEFVHRTAVALNDGRRAVDQSR
jgi:hypothetical protein